MISNNTLPRIIKPRVVNTRIIKPTVVNTNNNITEEQAESIANELHKPIRHKHPRRKVIVDSLDSIWGADLCEMKPEKGFKYILTIIDIWSKYAWGVPLKFKDGKTVRDAFEDVFNKSDRCPKHIWTDKGKEFYNTHVNSLFQNKQIKLYSTESELKSIVVERLNRTLKERMEKQFTINYILGRKSNWLEILPIIVESYNNTVHSKIKCTPVNAIKSEWQTHVAKHMRDNDDPVYNKTKTKFQVGDKVRIYKWKSTFEKGYTTRFTSELFVITEVHNTTPITYNLKDLNGEDIQGRFYNEELLKSDVPLNVEI
jgi:hypothetical protein